MSPPAEGKRVRFLPILSMAFLLRFGIVLLSLRHDPRQWFFSQTTELGRLAESLLQGHGLSSPFGGATGPSAFLAPGYPALVAFVFRIFGAYTFRAAAAILVLQVLFATGTVLAILLIARRAFSTRTANIAGTLWALSPPLIFLPTLFWESALSTLFLTGAMALALHVAGSPSLWKCLVLGLCCALAMLVNPALLLALLCISVWTIHASRTTASLKIRGAVLLFLTWGTLFAPWPMRNEHALHAFIPMRSNLGYELWQGNRAESNGGFSPALHPNVSREEFARYDSLGEVGYMREKSALAKAAIRANPLRFTVLTLKRFAAFWLGLGSHQQSALIIAHIVLTTGLGIEGLAVLLRRRRPLALLFCGPLLIFPLPYYITHADFRFRLVLDPLLTLLSAYAVTHWIELKERKLASDPA